MVFITVLPVVHSNFQEIENLHGIVHKLIEHTKRNRKTCFKQCTIYIGINKQ